MDYRTTAVVQPGKNDKVVIRVIGQPEWTKWPESLLLTSSIAECFKEMMNAN